MRPGVLDHRVKIFPVNELTIDQAVIAPGDDVRAAHMYELVTQRVPVKGLRVLDLGCRTGAMGAALAATGATVLGIEGRAENIAMAPVRAGMTLLQGDVRNLCALTDDCFDVTLCFGLLYHLEPSDAVALLQAMRQVTVPGGFAIVDTHICSGVNTVMVGNRSYNGCWWHELGDAQTLWSSIGNLKSFWFTLQSLMSACGHSGWSLIEELPGSGADVPGRVWLRLS